MARVIKLPFELEDQHRKLDFIDHGDHCPMFLPAFGSAPAKICCATDFEPWPCPEAVKWLAVYETLVGG